MPERRAGWGRDRTGQMMLFAAVVLLLSFIALAGAVTRINQLATETVREQDNPMLLEVEAVLEGIDTAIAVLEVEHMGDNASLQADLTAILEHLKTQESARGYLFTWQYTHDTSLGECRVSIVLHNGVTRVGLDSQEAFPRDPVSPACP